MRVYVCVRANNEEVYRNVLHALLRSMSVCAVGEREREKVRGRGRE